MARVSLGEHRGIVEATIRIFLSRVMWLTSRGRIDIRDVDDEFSTRFRYRLGAFDDTRFDRATGSAIRPAPRSRDTTDAHRAV
jgi:hypothetical protein